MATPTQTLARSLEPQSPVAAPDVARGAIGRLHALTTGSRVDGPGIRTVIRTAGCQLRCQYCDDPDSWSEQGGAPASADAVVHEVTRHAPFLAASHGGVTVTGGEPLVQARFTSRILRGCRDAGVHTALDTNGWLGDQLTDADLEAIDLVLLDLKSFDPPTHRRVTGGSVEPVLRFARRLSDLGRPTWLRFVLVPGLTDAPANVAGLAAFAATLSGVERVEVLPFHQTGRSGWERLGRRYPLARTEPPSAEAVARVVEVFRARGLPAV